MTRKLAAFVLAAALAAGCHDGAVITRAGAPPMPADAGASAPGSPPAPAPALPPMSSTDGAPPPPSGRPVDETPRCAEETQMAEHVPLDLLLLMDRSSSMAGAKWNMSRAAIMSFIGDARSAGLGVGLQFFPLAPGADAPCGGDPDCGFPAFGAPRFCLQ